MWLTHSQLKVMASPPLPPGQPCQSSAFSHAGHNTGHLPSTPIQLGTNTSSSAQSHPPQSPGHSSPGVSTSCQPGTNLPPPMHSAPSQSWPGLSCQAPLPHLTNTQTNPNILPSSQPTATTSVPGQHGPNVCSPSQSTSGQPSLLPSPARSYMPPPNLLPSSGSLPPLSMPPASLNIPSSQPGSGFVTGVAFRSPPGLGAPGTMSMPVGGRPSGDLPGRPTMLTTISGPPSVPQAIGNAQSSYSSFPAAPPLVNPQGSWMAPPRMPFPMYPPSFTMQFSVTQQAANSQDGTSSATQTQATSGVGYRSLGTQGNLGPPGVPGEVVTGAGNSLRPWSEQMLNITGAPVGPAKDLLDESDDLLMSSVPAHTRVEDDSANDVADLDSWTAHKTEDGTIYYYNSITGLSTYQRPAGFKGEPDKVASQPTAVAWERLVGTDWALVTTNDGKRYYYNTVSQVTSWQVPIEIQEMRRKQHEEQRAIAESVSAAPGAEKSTVSFTLNVPAAVSGGRESLGYKSVVSASLDLIKKKLQDPGSLSSMPTIPNNSNATTAGNGTSTDAGNGTVDASKEKPKGNGDASSSDYSDSEEEAPTKEERVAQFKEMLKEKGVAPFSKWEKELPRIIFDPRFKAIPSHTERRSIFDHYVRTRAEEERKEKRAAQKAAIEGFKQILEEAIKDITHSTTYESFAKAWAHDPRFEALDRKDREALLNERVLPLRRAEEERCRVLHAAAVSEFQSMLQEKTDINASSRWSKVKEVLRHDSRYRAIKHEEREGLFNAYVAQIRAVEQEAERAARVKREEEEKQREREREMRKRKEREEQELERMKAKARRKDAVGAYQALLTEKIKDAEASWTESRSKLEKDPSGRGANPELDLTDRERLFRDHVRDLFEHYVREYKALLAEIFTPEVVAKHQNEGRNVLASWSEARKLLKADSRYGKTPRREKEHLWERYAEGMLRRLKASAPNAKEEKVDAKMTTVDGTGRSPGLKRSHSRR